MSIKEIHINKSKNKNYIIPTNEWLNPIMPFISNDFNAKSLIMLSNLVDQGKVIVKITKNSNYHKIKTINKYIKSNPNMLYTLKTIQCSEVEINYEVQYKDCLGYCNKDEIETENIEIVLEIMKLYQGSLNNYLNKFSLGEIEDLMKQILFCQLHIYNKIGFVHNDIHLGNILVKKIDDSKELETLIYTIRNRKYMIKTNFKLILSDFDQSIIYDQQILPLEKYNEIFTIQYNIIRTINVFKKMLKMSDQQIVSESLEKSLNSFSYHYLDYSEKILRSYYKQNRDYDDFIERSILECILLLNDIWILLYNKNLFPAHAL